MMRQWYQSSATAAVRGLDIVRVGVALIILMHPLHGFYYTEDIPLFGEFLSSLGYPFGLALAWTVLILQTISSIALIANRFVVPACLTHIVIICFGIIHVHAQHGWYVVGGGTGGMEWGFILLSSLAGVLWAYWPRKHS